MAPKKLPVRPTTDMAKEGLFNILRNRYYLDEMDILDLFAGTGNISFEFASRGCSSITSVDSHPACVQFISKVTKELDFPITTIKSDVFKFLQRTGEKFDIIFADPPYDFSEDAFMEIANTVLERALLSEQGVLIIEHSDQTSLSGHPNFVEQRKYGGSIFSFLKRRPISPILKSRP